MVLKKDIKIGGLYKTRCIPELRYAAIPDKSQYYLSNEGRPNKLVEIAIGDIVFVTNKPALLGEYCVLSLSTLELVEMTHDDLETLK